MRQVRIVIRPRMYCSRQGPVRRVLLVVAVVSLKSVWHVLHGEAHMLVSAVTEGTGKQEAVQVRAAQVCQSAITSFFCRSLLTLSPRRGATW